MDACGHRMSADRLKTTFRNYYLDGRPHEKKQIEERAAGRSPLHKRLYDLEYSLSKLFTPRQKELVLKKFKGEKTH